MRQEKVAKCLAKECKTQSPLVCHQLNHLKLLKLCLKSVSCPSDLRSQDSTWDFFLICLLYLGMTERFLTDKPYSTISHLPHRPALT